MAPVKAPFWWPNSIASSIVSGSARAVDGDERAVAAGRNCCGWRGRGPPCRCPSGPLISTVMSDAATRSARRQQRRGFPGSAATGSCGPRSSAVAKPEADRGIVRRVGKPGGIAVAERNRRSGASSPRISVRAAAGALRPRRRGTGHGRPGDHPRKVPIAKPWRAQRARPEHISGAAPAADGTMDRIRLPPETPSFLRPAW